MTIQELRKKLLSLHGEYDVMIHDGKLLAETHRGKQIIQQSAEGDELGRGTASQWIDLGVPIT